MTSSSKKGGGLKRGRGKKGKKEKVQRASTADIMKAKSE